jgi:hypothetical protein
MEPDKRIVTSDDLGSKIIKALGLDAHIISSIYLSLTAGNPAELHVTKLITEDEAKTIEDIISTYNLVDKTDEP